MKDFTDGFFDFIFSSTTLHYIENLDQVFKNIYLLLKAGGKSIISTMHPVYTAQYPIDQMGKFPKDEDWIVKYLYKDVRSYVQPWIEYNDEVENYLSTSYHHTFGDYINAIISSGLMIESIEEPKPPIEWKEKFYKRYASYMEIPTFLIFSLMKK